jgi:hypothetical protein
MLKRHGVIEPDRLAEVVEDLEPDARRHRRWAWILVLVGLPIFVGLLAVDIAIEGRAAWRDLVSTVTNPVMVPIWIGVVLVPIISARQQRLRRVRAVMLRHQCCPHCGYDLRGLPVDPADQATVCPECACAWELSDRSQVGADGTVCCPSRLRATILLAVTALLGAVAAAGFLMYWR